jgi:hypothetical protein
MDTTCDLSTDTDALLADLVAEAAAQGANPEVFRQGPWVGVMADEAWVCGLGYDRDPWTPSEHPRDPSTPLAVPGLTAVVERVAVVTRSVIHHCPPTHNGVPPVPQVFSKRPYVAFIPLAD